MRRERGWGRDGVGDTMVQAAHSEHAGPKASLGSDASERIAMRFSLTHTTYSRIAGACLRLSWYPHPISASSFLTFYILPYIFVIR